VKSPEKVKPKNLNLTVTQLKQFPGLENLDDEQALEIIESLEAFAQLTFTQFTAIYGKP
jgi:hypothetical protein